MSSYIHRRIFEADKNYKQRRIAVKTADAGNFDEFEDSSDNKAATCTMSMTTTDITCKYRCNKIQSTEIFDFLAWRCQQE